MTCFLGIDQQAPDQSYAKTNENNTVYTVDDMNIMRREFFSDFSGQHYFQKITGKNNGKAGYKNDQSLFDGVADKCSGSG